MHGLCEYLFEDKRLEDGGEYAFEVRAVDFFGNVSEPIRSAPAAFRRGSWTPPDAAGKI